MRWPRQRNQCPCIQVRHQAHRKVCPGVEHRSARLDWAVSMHKATQVRPHTSIPTRIGQEAEDLNQGTFFHRLAQLKLEISSFYIYSRKDHRASLRFRHHPERKKIVKEKRFALT